MNNTNEEDLAPAKSAEDEITPATEAIVHSTEIAVEQEEEDVEEEKENENKFSSITTNNGATSSKGLF